MHVTVGSKGSLVCGPDENPKEVKGFETEVNDTNGAGDMYAAAALSMIVRGFTTLKPRVSVITLRHKLSDSMGLDCRPLNHTKQ